MSELSARPERAIPSSPTSVVLFVSVVSISNATLSSHGGTSQRRPSADANLQAELESLRASVTRMSEKYDHLHAKNVELEHDYRTLKRNWEMNQTQGSQRSPTQEPERTQPNQPEHSHHNVPTQPRPSKGKGPLYPETTKSQLLRISPPKNRPHEPTKVYRDCRDRILDRQTEPPLISVNLQDPCVKTLQHN
ncbi:unnamed protein product [Prunus armeniaca]